jgi:carotenoid cleavage dioxygenase-like enzyme
LYRSDRTGKILQTSSFPLNGIPLIHDFAVVGEYLVFFIPPVRLDVLPVLAGFSSFSDALHWKPQLGTQILIFDRQTLSLVNRQEAEPWFQWHFANGYREDAGTLAIDFVRYRDFTSNRRLKEIATGTTQVQADGLLWRVRLNAQTGKVRTSERLLDRPGEFPSVSPIWVGENAPQIYLSLHRRDADRMRDLYGSIGCYDCRSGQLTEGDLGENRYPSEPIFAPHPDGSDRGWLLTVTYDGTLEQSQVWVFENDGVDREPICRLALPEVIPLGFHGTWQGQP